MTNCLNCNAEIEQKEGKREKKFCDGNCRATYWAKRNGKKEPKYVLFSTFKDLQEKYQNVISKIDPKAGDMHLANKSLHDNVLKNVSQPQNKTNTDNKKENEGESVSKVDNGLILAQIELVKSAKMPDGMSKRVWEFDQNKKLKALHSQL